MKELAIREHIIISTVIYFPYQFMLVLMIFLNTAAFHDWRVI